MARQERTHATAQEKRAGASMRLPSSLVVVELDMTARCPVVIGIVGLNHIDQLFTLFN